MWSAWAEGSHPRQTNIQGNYLPTHYCYFLCTLYNSFYYKIHKSCFMINIWSFSNFFGILICIQGGLAITLMWIYIYIKSCQNRSLLWSATVLSLSGRVIKQLYLKSYTTSMGFKPQWVLWNREPNILGQWMFIIYIKR